MQMLLYIFGGVALLLFAVRLLRAGLDRLFGRRLGTWLQRIGNRPALAFLGGVGAAAAAPSSTTMSLLAVQSVQAGQMTTTQMLRVMLGANIGMTVMVQLVALDLQVLAPLLLVIGVILYQYTRSTRSRGIGQLLVSLGLIFLALGLIKQGVPDAIAPESDLGRLIQIASHYPVGMTLLAAVFAIVTQSSTATIGLAIGLVIAGAVDFDVALPVVFGANVGIAVTTLIFGWSQVESRRLAFANLSLKVLVAALGLLLLQVLLNIMPRLEGYEGTQVATAHTLFNAAIAIIGLPLAGTIMRVMEQAVPAPQPEHAAFGPRHIIGSIGDTSIALGQSLRELMHVSEIVRSMLSDVWKALKRSDEALAHSVGERDDKVDLLDREIKRFLTRVVRNDTDSHDIEEQMRQLRYLAELETIGDIIDKNLSELVLKKIRLGVEFSEDGEKELDDFHKRVAENLLIADTAFTTRDRKLAEQLLRHKERLNRDEQRLRDKHFTRLTRGFKQTHETSAIHLDLLTHLRRINSSISHVAYAVLEAGEQAHETPPD